MSGRGGFLNRVKRPFPARYAPILGKAVAWIALNDEPLETERGVVSEMISVALIADVFNLAPEAVADRVIDARRKAGAR